ncbi:hypothetical protein CU048_04610 [Beijerinckiaceae bacterium]|nr:hypothetical protein CU048_04610 [Beijerinckiaceae bacterium]
MPAGSREGGRFQGGEGGAAGASPEKPIQLPEIVITPLPPSGGGIGDNGGLPLEQPPKIPEDEPLSERLRNAFAKLAARWLARALAGAAFGPEGEFIVGLEAAAETVAWLYDKYPFIKSYLDEPKSLDELQRNVGKPEKGYEVHHIVEQTSAERDGYSREDIDAPDNLVRIPTLKHWEITGWYMTPNEDFGYISPREYLKGKSWDAKRKVGLDALIDAGVLMR